MISLVKKNPFTTVGQIQNTHQHQEKTYTEGSPQDVTIGEPQKQEDQIRVCQKTSKRAVQLWNNILWTDETKINLYQHDGKRRV